MREGPNLLVCVEVNSHNVDGLESCRNVHDKSLSQSICTQHTHARHKTTTAHW
jgi:hypothetical protein